MNWLGLMQVTTAWAQNYSRKGNHRLLSQIIQMTLVLMFSLNVVNFFSAGSAYSKQASDYPRYSHLTSESVSSLLEKSAAENQYLSSLGHRFAVSIFEDGGAVGESNSANHLLKVNLVPYFRVLASSMVDKKPEELDYELSNLIVWYSKGKTVSEFPATRSTALDKFIYSQFELANGRGCYFGSELAKQDKTKMINAFLFVHVPKLTRENSISIADCFHAGISRSFGVAPNFDAYSGHYGTDYIRELFLASVIQKCSSVVKAVDERRKCISAEIEKSIK